MVTSTPTLPIRRNITIQRGARKALSFDIRDPDGQLLDVGAPRMQIRNKPEGSLILDCTPYFTQPGIGLYELVLEPEQTSALPIPAVVQWYYDIFLDDIVVGLGTKLWFLGTVTGMPRITQ